jgi:hypothetical protein
MKDILKKGYKIKNNFNEHTKNLDNHLLDDNDKTCISKNNDKKVSKVYNLNEAENEKKKTIDNEKEKNVKGNNLKENFNNYNSCKINQSKNKLNYKSPTDTISKNQIFISKVIKSSNSKNNEIKETEIKSKKSTEKINKIKNTERPYIIETSYKKEDYAVNEPKSVRNKIIVQKIFLPKRNNILIKKQNHTIDLDYEQTYNNDNKINFSYNNKVSKIVEDKKCVSTPKNRDILIYSLTNKYPHNNHRKKNILDINQKEKKIYDRKSQNNKNFKENNNINLTTINKNNKKKSKLIQYFNKKLNDFTLNKKARNGEYIHYKLDTFDLSKEKKDKTLIQNNNTKINNYFNKVTKILQNKYGDSQWIDISIKPKRKLNNLKIRKKEPLNITESISTEKENKNFYINDENKKRFNYNTMEYNDNSLINKEIKKKYKDNFRLKNSIINSKELALNSQREKINLEVDKNNNDYSKYKQNINNRFDSDIKIPKKKDKLTTIDIKNINNNMKFYKNVNYIIYNNNIKVNNNTRKIKSDINNNSINTNDKNKKLLETEKIRNSYQTNDINNSRNINDLYFVQNRNKEESLNFNTFKNINTNKNYIKKIDIKNNITLNIMNNNNFVKRTLDITNNDSLERKNLTSKNQRVLNTKFDCANNANYISKGKSYFLFDKINNINELQKSNYETQKYNSIINLGNDIYSFPSTYHINNIYPIENNTLLNTIEIDRTNASAIGK